MSSAFQVSIDLDQENGDDSGINNRAHRFVLRDVMSTAGNAADSPTKNSEEWLLRNKAANSGELRNLLELCNARRVTIIENKILQVF